MDTGVRNLPGFRAGLHLVRHVIGDGCRRS